ncbi:MAG: hypothetical protein NTY39_03635 [Campylobacterales bacterium]|nr:hypothetical protein [Campylobacterales bacterium]
MFRLLLLTFWFVPFLFAENTLLLDTQIRMIPKIMALNTDILRRSSSSDIILGVISDQKGFSSAVANKINNYYKGQVGNLKFTTEAITLSEFLARRDLSFVYLLDASQSTIVQAITISKEKKVPSFVYNIGDLPLGALGSISIERSTIITLNKNVLTSGNYHFNDALYQMARWIE